MLLPDQTLIFCLYVSQVWCLDRNVLEGLTCSAEVGNVNFVEGLVFEVEADFSCLLDALFGEFAGVLATNNTVLVLLGFAVTGDEEVELYLSLLLLLHC